MDEQLIAAVEARDLSRVEALLANGANPNARKDHKTAYQLVPYGADDIKCALIEAGADAPELKHSLVWVVLTGRLQAVRALIARGADINVSTHAGTPIQVAARQGYLDIVDALIAAGADVDAGSSISTPLLEALEQGQTAIALHLIAAGADPNRASAFGRMPPLAIAAAQGLTPVVSALIAAGADVNCHVPQITLNRTAIQQEAAIGLQAAFGAMESLGRMMESLADLDEDDRIPGDRLSGLQSEMAQIESNSAQIQGRSTKPETAVDVTPVVLAARGGHVDALVALLEAGADPHCKDGEGRSAYDWAVHNEYPDVLAVLHQFGIDGTRYSLEERLLMAAEAGDEGIVQDCLHQGANPDTRDTRRIHRGQSPLMLAASNGHLSIVQALLAVGANPNLTDQEPDARPLPRTLLEHTGLETVLEMGYRLGRTALMQAAIKGQVEIVQALLHAGAHPDHADGIGCTALLLAAEYQHLAVVQALVTAGSRVNQANDMGNTPLLLAAKQGARDIVEWLLAQGADINQVDRDRETALMKAVTMGHLPLVSLLLEQGAEVNAVSRDHKTAIALAAGASRYVEVDEDAPGSGGIREYRDDGSCWEWQPLPEDQLITMVQQLLQAGADPNIPNCETTPLLEAARNGYLHLLQVLLNAGARLEVRDRNGDTAVSLATLYQQQAILTFLQAYTGTDLSEFGRRKSQRHNQLAADLEVNEDEMDLEEEEFSLEDEDERWGDELPQPDFTRAAQNPAYQQAVHDLAEHCGSPPVSHEQVPGWFSIHVHSKRRNAIQVDTLHCQFLERGCFVYEPDASFTEVPEKLCILPTTDKYEVIALHQTNGCNYGIGPGYIVQWLQALEQEQPFVLTCIAHDTLGGRFLTPIQDPHSLAARMYDFCPDIVDQGCGSVAELAESLIASDRLFFWWD